MFLFDHQIRRIEGIRTSYNKVVTDKYFLRYQSLNCWTCENSMFWKPWHEAFLSRAKGLVIARLTMHHGTVLGDANKKPVPKKQSRDALSTSLLPGLLRNSKMANIRSFSTFSLTKFVTNWLQLSRRLFKINKAKSIDFPLLAYQKSSSEDSR